MEKLKLIYNPDSGNKSFKDNLDTYIRALQKGGFDIGVLRIEEIGDVDKHLAEADGQDVILASGGDGTVSAVVNAMMKNNVSAALGIIPTGTANDFARYLGLTDMPAEQLCEVFNQRNITPCDVGYANGEYFINVCGGGLLTQVGHTIEPIMKDIFGKFSYYIKGITQIPNFAPIPLRITTDKGVVEEEVYMYLVLNSPGAGSFDNLVGSGRIDDGLLDFFAVKVRPLTEIAMLFVKILAGEHLKEPSVIHFSAPSFKIEVLSDDKLFRATSIDGDMGPSAPLNVNVLPDALRLLTKKS